MLRSGGLPCRFAACDVVFTVSDQSSLSAVLAAGALRTEHEITVHDYHHQRMDELQKPYSLYAPKRATPDKGGTDPRR